MASLPPLTESLIPFLDPYLPRINPTAVLDKAETDDSLPFITLTFAQSIDSRISSSPGARTSISHLETKTMTHYLRSKHDAILIGIGTFLADDPILNCRFKINHDDSSHLIRPVIIDPTFKLGFYYEKSKLRQAFLESKGLPPIVLVRLSEIRSNPEIKSFCTLHKIMLLPIETEPASEFRWLKVFKELKKRHIKSIMVEGGASVINSLLLARDPSSGKSLINSLIITIGPVFLGKSGVEVSPCKELRLTDVSWWTGVQDSVICSHLK
ncbi:hypothetical protein KL930_003737 [Ogataea haglerorum]|uniref:2,5-diamino-6-ribosylamino-4(3H)-pyrimidinone 5'-phosphate reductase n=1 Tax=Ogataea haglerorum TaxID=1937702 RepID=A0AAN6D3W5_9ASCO|nr:uncharacterized protein KL911_003876 [Ogataea haglerorum]KAG7694418.1 hypothetical protein KL915_003385 [Ogataea haglerorum]KAG7695381.1 hypothetical protein KL951_003823 [Ogataea haglerorum]KAG7705245.1 hypothetical protein KL914_003931 [Ogataea haglerorum]KAG7705502.1 hypothetical protein KL950_003938 [Ogataea haglerorum]KAG7716627.1 hypothetical protein KL913_003143 [Ogataea haglerorum]